MVRVAVSMVRHALRNLWSLPRAAVLLAGIAVLPTPTQADSISLLSPGAENVIAPTTYGKFAPPIGSDPAFSFAFGWSAVGPMLETLGSDPVTALLRGTWSAVGPLPETLGPDPALTALLQGAVSTDAEEFGVGGGTVPRIRGAAPGGIQSVCSDDLAMRLQAGGQFWTAQGVRAAQVQFAPGASTGSSFEIASSMGNPTQGPSGDRSNLAPPRPAGGWCRPVPVSFGQSRPLASGQSSPLGSRAFWIPVIVLLVGLVVFLLSRGLKMPA